MKPSKNLLYEPYMTHQEIADIYGTSRAAIQLTEKNALRKLRVELKKRGITAEDFFGGMNELRNNDWYASKRKGNRDE